MEYQSSFISPKVFISYCYLPDDNYAWVMDLAGRISQAGIPVTTDRDRDPATDMEALVQKVVNDTSYTHILIICNSYYARMADGRGRDLPVQGPVISERLYEVNENKRFIPIVRELDEAGQPIMPKYLINKTPIFANNELLWDKACEALISRIKANNEKGSYNTTPVSAPPRPLPPTARPGKGMPAWALILVIVSFLLAIYITAFRIVKAIHTIRDKALEHSYRDMPYRLEPYNKKKTEIDKDDRRYNQIWVIRGEKIILTDENGNLLPDVIYDEAGNFYNGMAKVQRNGKWGYITRDGREVVHCLFDEVSLYFTEDKASVQLNGLWGYVDKKGNIIVPMVYAQCSPFSEGLAAVKVGNYWGFINEHGDLDIPPIYDLVESFHLGHAQATYSGKTYFIDKNGKKVIGK